MTRSISLIVSALVTSSWLGVAYGQTAAPSAQQTPSVSSGTTGPAATDNPEKSKEVAPEMQIEKDAATLEVEEFDQLAVGAWAVLTKNLDDQLTDKLMLSGAEKCITPASVKKLDIEPAAERKLPEARNLFGDVIYFRTKKGLQRFDIQTGVMLLLPELKKLVRSPTLTVWAIRGKAAGYRMRFTNASKRGGRAQFMLEESVLYLRCNFLPDRTKAKQ